MTETVKDTRPVPRLDRLANLAAAMDQAEALQKNGKYPHFNMSQWGMLKTNNYTPGVVIRDSECFTVACAGGWYCILYQPKDIELRVLFEDIMAVGICAVGRSFTHSDSFVVMARHFGITRDDATILFSALQYQNVMNGVIRPHHVKARTLALMDCLRARNIRPWIVCAVDMSGGLTPIGTDSSDGGPPRLVVFPTEEAAQVDVQDLVDSTEAAVANGHMLTASTPGDFKIVRLTQQLFDEWLRSQNMEPGSLTIEQGTVFEEDA